MNKIVLWVEKGKETDEQIEFINQVTQYRTFVFLGVEYWVMSVEWEHSEDGYTFKVDLLPVKRIK